jgi:hypothetical protein
MGWILRLVIMQLYYADRWGSVEVSPRKYRFFENSIRRHIEMSCVSTKIFLEIH